MAACAWVFIHSPLVGPLTWQPVADEFRRGGGKALVPSLTKATEAGPPYWAHHAAAVADLVQSTSVTGPLVLVAHSGAGPLLPAIRERMELPVAGYLFVDASLPRAGASRLDLLDLFESPDVAAEFRMAAKDGVLPTWRNEDLRETIPDPALRRRFVAELQPLPLAVYEEPLPVPPEWPDAPCGYLQFSPIYEPWAMHAHRAGWACTQLAGGHFHMLVDPPTVADTLLRLANRMEILVG